MIIVTLGSYSSGSTWIFNVVRSIVSTVSDNSFSIYCENSNEFLQVLSGEFDHVIVKAHSLDQNFLNLIKVTGAKLIVSTRDPRDSYVSLSQRFGYHDTELLDQIARSFTVTALARADLECLTWVYEDGFTENVESIDRIANYLGIALDNAISSAIFAQHSKSSVRSAVKHLEAQGHDAKWFDPATHWHPRHVGDGQVGKWRSLLSPERAIVLHDALLAYYDGTYRRQESIRWQPSLFHFPDSRNAVGENTLLQANNAENCLVYGPYLYLPSGQWRAHFLLSIEVEGSASFRIDIGVSGKSIDLYAMKRVRISKEDKNMPSIEFEHFDHLRPVEARIHGVSNRAPTDVSFSGVLFSWLGALEPNRNDAVRIVPADSG